MRRLALALLVGHVLLGPTAEAQWVGAASGWVRADKSAMPPVMAGDSGSGGTAGLVPAPAAGDASKYLRGDATWAAVTGFDASDYCASQGMVARFLGSPIALGCAAGIQSVETADMTGGSLTGTAGEVAAYAYAFAVTGDGAPFAYAYVDGGSLAAPSAETPWTLTMPNVGATQAMRAHVTADSTFYLCSWTGPTLSISSFESAGCESTGEEELSYPYLPQERVFRVFDVSSSSAEHAAGVSLVARTSEDGVVFAPGVFGDWYLSVSTLDYFKPSLFLGTAGNPDGIFVDRGARLHVTTAIHASQLYFSEDTTGPSIQVSGIAPDGACVSGSLFIYTGGGTDSTFWVCENTAWVAK